MAERHLLTAVREGSTGGFTFTASCSECGSVIRRVTGANSAGIRHARAQAEQLFETHFCPARPGESPHG